MVEDPKVGSSTRAPGTGNRLSELARLFLRLGATAFGGPAAHIALMEHEVVQRKGWLTRDEFLDLLGATNLIPGPNSTEMAIHIGWKQARWAGLIVAGIAFILPAAVQVLALAWVLDRYGTRLEAGRLLYGIKPVIIAMVVQALGRLGRQALKTRALAMIATICMALTIPGVNELIILLARGAWSRFCAGQADVLEGEPARWCLAPYPSAAWPSARPPLRSASCPCSCSSSR